VWLFIFLAIAVYLSTAIGAYVTRSFRQVVCYEQLRALGVSLDLYYSQNGRYPADWAALVTWAPSCAQSLHCGKDDQNGEASYVLRGNDLAERADRQVVMAFERHPKHFREPARFGRRIIAVLGFNANTPRIRHVLYGNGYVAGLTEDEFQDAILADNRFRRAAGFPEKH